MAVNPNIILKEPGVVQFGSQTFYSKGAITAEFIEPKFQIETDQFGKVSERPESRSIEVKFTGVGELEALDVLFPHGGLGLGGSIFGSSDSACSIFTTSGKSLVLHNAAVKKMPDLLMGHKVTPFGEITIVGVVKRNVDITTANSIFTYTDTGVTYPGDAPFSPAAIKTLAYKGAWGSSSPWSEFTTEAGFTLSLGMDLTEEEGDGSGIYDITLADLTATVTATPLGVTLDDLISQLNFQGPGNALGAEMATGDDLVIINQFGDLELHVQLYGAILDPASATFSAKEKAVGELTWKATREIASGSASPLFYVGTTAPS